ncbi:hypothetical protein HK105_204982 [Polyrhizophydium stewartii]|uniref:Transmembrane protein n=1 Tax=Polyrhizophydium stewartii TaxID=2732419 RepID=A0ABR4N766_9FUNG
MAAGHRPRLGPVVLGPPRGPRRRRLDRRPRHARPAQSPFPVPAPDDPALAPAPREAACAVVDDAYNVIIYGGRTSPSSPVASDTRTYVFSAGAWVNASTFAINHPRAAGFGPSAQPAPSVGARSATAARPEATAGAPPNLPAAAQGAGGPNVALIASITALCIAVVVAIAAFVVVRRSRAMRSRKSPPSPFGDAPQSPPVADQDGSGSPHAPSPASAGSHATAVSVEPPVTIRSRTRSLSRSSQPTAADLLLDPPPVSHAPPTSSTPAETTSPESPAPQTSKPEPLAEAAAPPAPVNRAAAASPLPRPAMTAIARVQAQAIRPSRLRSVITADDSSLDDSNSTKSPAASISSDSSIHVPATSAVSTATSAEAVVGGSLVDAARFQADAPAVPRVPDPAVGVLMSRQSSLDAIEAFLTGDKTAAAAAAAAVGALDPSQSLAEADPIGGPGLRHRRPSSCTDASDDSDGSSSWQTLDSSRQSSESRTRYMLSMPVITPTSVRAPPPAAPIDVPPRAAGSTPPPPLLPTHLALPTQSPMPSLSPISPLASLASLSPLSVVSLPSIPMQSLSSASESTSSLSTISSDESSAFGVVNPIFVHPSGGSVASLVSQPASPHLPAVVVNPLAIPSFVASVSAVSLGSSTAPQGSSTSASSIATTGSSPFLPNAAFASGMTRPGYHPLDQQQPPPQSKQPQSKRKSLSSVISSLGSTGNVTLVGPPSNSSTTSSTSSVRRRSYPPQSLERQLGVTVDQDTPHSPDEIDTPSTATGGSAVMPSPVRDRHGSLSDAGADVGVDADDEQPHKQAAQLVPAPSEALDYFGQHPLLS